MSITLVNTQLPAEFLEPYQPLLQSADLEVQQMSSLSLVNFLLEGNCKWTIQNTCLEYLNFHIAS